jgi:hypothetical protein
VQDDEDQLDDTVLRAAGTRGLDSGSSGSGSFGSGSSGSVSSGSGAFDPDRPDDGLDDTVLGAGRHRAPAAAAAPASSASSTPDVERALPAPVPSIRIGTRTIRLDHPVVVGRRPGLPRVVQGPVPELVTVPSPTGLVSSSHVRFHASGPTAVIDDLHATNGTVVRAPGAPPHRMPAGASMVVLTGTVVDIGDGATIEVLSPYLRSVPPGGRESSGP